jgi:hypothetical protein
MRLWLLLALSMATSLLLVTRVRAEGVHRAVAGEAVRSALPPRLLDDLKAARAQTFLEVARQRIDGSRYPAAIRALREVELATRDPELRFEMVRCLHAMGELERAVRAHRLYVASFRSPLERLVAAARFGELVKPAPAPPVPAAPLPPPPSVPASHRQY